MNHQDFTIAHCIKMCNSVFSLGRGFHKISGPFIFGEPNGRQVHPLDKWIAVMTALAVLLDYRKIFSVCRFIFRLV